MCGDVDVMDTGLHRFSFCSWAYGFTFCYPSIRTLACLRTFVKGPARLPAGLQRAPSRSGRRHRELPGVPVADTGYWHGEQMQRIGDHGIQVLIPPDIGRDHAGAASAPGAPRQRVRQRTRNQERGPRGADAHAQGTSAFTSRTSSSAISALTPRSASLGSALRVTAGSPSRAPRSCVRCSPRRPSSPSAPPVRCARSPSVSARAAAARSRSSPSRASPPCSGTRSRARRTARFSVPR